MIITITGKPCSGKGATVAKFLETHKFEKFSAGDIFRKIGADRGLNVLEINQVADVKDIDKLVDDEIVAIGERDLEKDIILDSRTAWHFIPKSFKVFLEISPEEAGRRLINSGRTTENVNVTLEDAIKDLNSRWKIECDRYKELYSFENGKHENYDLVIDTTNMTVEEVANKLYEGYVEFLKNR